MIYLRKLTIDDFGGLNLKSRIDLRRRLFSDASRDIFDRYEKKFIKKSKLHARNHKGSKRPWYKPSKGLMGKLHQGDVKRNLKEFLNMIVKWRGKHKKKLKEGQAHSKEMKKFYEKVSERYKRQTE